MHVVRDNEEKPKQNKKNWLNIPEFIVFLELF